MEILSFTLRNMGILIFYHYRDMWGRNMEIRAEPDGKCVNAQNGGYISFIYYSEPIRKIVSEQSKVLVASREILMYNLTHRLQVVISYT